MLFCETVPPKKYKKKKLHTCCTHVSRNLCFIFFALFFFLFNCGTKISVKCLANSVFDLHKKTPKYLCLEVTNGAASTTWTEFKAPREWESGADPTQKNTSSQKWSATKEIKPSVNQISTSKARNENVKSKQHGKKKETEKNYKKQKRRLGLAVNQKMLLLLLFFLYLEQEPVKIRENADTKIKFNSFDPLPRSYPPLTSLK